MTSTFAPPGATFDLDAAAGFLHAQFDGVPGLVNVAGTGGYRGEFFPTTADGLNAAARYAAQLDHDSRPSIYFRVATLAAEPAPGKRGSADDTLAVPFLWGDVDFGTEGHAHDPAKHDGRILPPDEAAAWRVITEAGMPAPTCLVHTGGGLNPLWTLAASVDQATAADLSIRAQIALQRAAHAHGWEYGTGVADLARLLRLPGTLNRKTSNARPCRVVGGTGQPIHPDQVSPLPPTAAPAASTPPRPYDPNRADGPLDAFAATATWADILEPEGWSHVGVERDGEQLWRRPGNPASHYSARAFEHVIVVHSESAGLPSGAGHKLTKGKLFAHLHHGGDTPAATTDLIAAAHGNGGSPAALALPEPVLAAVKAVTSNVFGFDLYDLIDRTALPAAPQPAPQPTAQVLPLDRGAAPVTPAPAPASPTSLAPFLLPDEVWTFSPTLARIHQAAMARLVCPDALLHAVLAIVASMLHHGSRVETGKGGSVLSYYGAVIGASGTGKSEALKVARELLTTWCGQRFFLDADSYIDAPLGSGEGLIEAFIGVVYEDQTGPDGKPVLDKLGLPKQVVRRAQVRHNALFVADEGRQVLAIDARKGSTVLATLCEMWSGAGAGQTNADKERSRRLDAGTYVVGLLAGFQVTTIDALFADEAGGTPQRFVYAPAEYAPFGVDLDTDLDAEWPGEVAPLGIPLGPVTVQLDDAQRREVRRALRAKAGGVSGDGPLDGHRMLLHCRIAALLTLLHAGAHAGYRVTAETWQLAGVLLDRSCTLRDWLAAQAERKAAELAQRKAEATIATTVRANELTQQIERVTRAAGQLVRAVERAGGTLTRGRALNGIRVDLRDVRDAALNHATRTGLVELSDDGRTVSVPDPRGGLRSV